MMIPCPLCHIPRQIRSRSEFGVAKGRRCRDCWNSSQEAAESGRCRRAEQLLACAEVDPIAVERMVSGRPPAFTTRAERQEAVTVLTNRGWGAKRIADQIGVTERTVERLRARRRVAA